MKTGLPGIYLYKRVVQAKLFIDEHYGEKIDLNTIAGEACFSKFHFIRLFTSIYGKTPHQYLKKVRLDNAILFLQKGASVSDVCMRIGFESATSFSNLFRQFTGFSPSDYQKKYFQRQEEIRQQPLAFIPNCFAEQKGWK